MAGVANYVQHMPDDPQFRCHPTTFLNQGRFLDEYDAPQVKPMSGRTAGNAAAIARFIARGKA